MPKSTRRTSRRSSPWIGIASAGGLILLLIVIAILFVSQALEDPAPSPGAPAVTIQATRPRRTLPAAAATAPVTEVQGSQRPDWFDVLFTSPDAPESGSFRGGLDEILAEAIDQASRSVDVAAYDLDLWSVRDSLLAAHRRGVAVRLVVDSDYLEGEEIQELKQAGIQILGDRREGFMHNKFVVIDGQEVWTGSMNLTANDVYRNNNNLIRIHSKELAEDYTTEFEEMFVEDLFGPDRLAQTPHPTVTIDDTLLEVYFSPDDGTAERLVELIQDARESIYFLAYSFTSDDLAQAMLERAENGVTVAGVLEESQYNSNQGTEYDNFVAAGLDVRLDGNPRNMHHKVLIIDKKTVVTGSYNFSRNAEERNDENTLVIHHEDVAADFVEEFEDVYAEALK